MLKWWYKQAENGVIEYTFGFGKKQLGKNFIFRLKKGNGCIWLGYRTDNGEILNDYQLDFEDLTEGKADVKEKSLPKDEPDYWEKLKHQYAGMAMQGMLGNKEMFDTIAEGVWPPNRPAYIAARCDEYATELVNRLKEESK